MGTRHLHEILSERVSISGTMQVKKPKEKKMKKKKKISNKKKFLNTLLACFIKNFCDAFVAVVKKFHSLFINYLIKLRL